MVEQMTPPSSHPITAFLEWFDQLPPALSQQLARLFILCTTEKSSDLSLDGEVALMRFRAYWVKKDFPLRMISRVVMVRSVFNLILNNGEILIEGTALSALSTCHNKNLVSIKPLQLNKARESWKRLSAGVLSDGFMTFWLQGAISGE